MTPSLKFILEVVAEHYRVTDSDIRLGVDPIAIEARGVYLWLASHMTGAGTFAAALFVAHPHKPCRDLIAKVSRRRSRDAEFADLLDQLALEIHAEGIVRQRLGRIVSDTDPRETALRIINARPRALTVGMGAIEFLASAFLSLMQEEPEPALTPIPAPAPPQHKTSPSIIGGDDQRIIFAFIGAHLRLVQSEHTVDEKFARQNYETCRRALVNQFMDKYLETSHGKKSKIENARREPVGAAN